MQLCAHTSACVHLCFLAYSIYAYLSLPLALLHCYSLYLDTVMYVAYLS